MGLPLGIDPNKQPHELYDDVDYKVFWSGWQQHKLDQAEHFVVTKMLPASGHNLIDIGCGYGRLADCYLGRFKHVVMFDGSLALLLEARQKYGDSVTYIAGDLHHIPIRMGSFENALMVRVFHHIIDSKACLSEFHRILCGGGKLIFTYRNKLYIMNQLKWMIHPTYDRPFCQEPSGIGTTLISHHPANVNQLLLQTGYSGFRYQGVGILDRLASKMGVMGKYCPTGEHFAPLFGKIKVAPWIFCRAVADGSPVLIESKNIDEILICLKCSSNLHRQADRYSCPSCGQSYPIIEGILDFRLN